VKRHLSAGRIRHLPAHDRRILDMTTNVGSENSAKRTVTQHEGGTRAAFPGRPLPRHNTASDYWRRYCINDDRAVTKPAQRV